MFKCWAAPLHHSVTPSLRHTWCSRRPRAAGCEVTQLLYAIGDIHGHATLLRRLLEAIPLAPEDTLVFLGDYIDRGDESREVIETLIGMRESRPTTVFLRGNHEQLMLSAREGPPPEPSPIPGLILYHEVMLNWLENGGVDTLRSYGVEDFLRWDRFVPREHWGFLAATQTEYAAGRYHFVHAGLLPPGETWDGEGTDFDPRLWIREPFLSSKADFDGRVVVFGHTPQTSGRPLIRPNKLGIDTWVYNGGPLTAAALDPEGDAPPRFYQAHFDTIYELEARG